MASLEGEMFGVHDTLTSLNVAVTRVGGKVVQRVGVNVFNKSI